MYDPQHPGYPFIAHAERDFFHSGVMAQRLSAILLTLEEMGKLDLVMKKVDWQAHGVSRLATEDWLADHKKVLAKMGAAKAVQDKELAKCAVLLEKPVGKLKPRERELLRKHNIL